MKYFLAVFTGIVFAGVTYIVLYLASNQNRYESLVAEGIQTVGVVVAKQPDNHQSIIFKFRADELDYIGTGGANGGVSFDDVRVGSPVPVVYDPSYPLNSFLGDPKIVIYSDNRFFVPASIILGLIVAVLSAGLVFILSKIRKRPE